MIIAVPEQRKTVASGIGVPEYACVITCWLWSCDCGTRSERVRFSHAAGALEMGDRHEAVAQCQPGQLVLFPIGGAR